MVCLHFNSSSRHLHTTANTHKQIERERERERERDEIKGQMPPRVTRRPVEHVGPTHRTSLAAAALTVAERPAPNALSGPEAASAGATAEDRKRHSEEREHKRASDAAGERSAPGAMFPPSHALPEGDDASARLPGNR